MEHIPDKSNVSGNDLQALEIRLRMIDEEERNIKVKTDIKLKELNKHRQFVRDKFTSTINKKSRGIIVDDYHLLINGIIQAFCTALSDTVIMDLKASDGTSIAVIKCEDMHGQHDYLNEYVPSGRRIIITFKNNNVNIGDILFPT